MAMKSLMFFIYCFDFLNVYLPKQLGRSENTIASYIDTLTILKRYIENECELDICRFTFADCTFDFIQSFLAWLGANGSSNSTCNQRLAGIKGYLEYCAIQDISINSVLMVIKRIRPLPVKRTIKPTLSEIQLKEIMQQAPDTYKGKRNRLILLLLYETAMRVSEIVSVRVSDLHIARDIPYISIMGKGKKERNIVISSKLADILTIYLSRYHDPDVTYLFYSYLGGIGTPLSPRSVQTFLKTYADKAREYDSTIPLKVHPHMYRRSKATKLYQNGMALELVSSFLGHSQLETTRIYARPSMEMMRTEIEKSIPEEAYKVKPRWKNDKDFASKLGLR